MRLKSFAICALAVCVLSSQAPAGQYLGKPFPNFDAVDPISKRKFELNNFRGKVVLVDFWATWCPPCRAEIPNIKSIHEKYRDKGFEVISISLDQDAGKFKSYVGSNGMKWVHVMDGGGWQTRLAKKYGIRSIPAMFLLDHDGIVISDSARGPGLASAVENAISKLPATPATQDEQPSSGKGPATIDRIRADLETLSQHLAAAAQGPQKLVENIQEVRKSLEAKPADASSESNTGDLCATLKTEVVRLRSELFAIGLLNGVQVKSPIATGEATAAAIGSGQQQCVATARTALDAMESSVSSAGKTLQVIAGQVEEFRTQLAKEPITLQQARQKYTNLNNNATKAMQRWSSAWKTQLNDLDAMLAPLGDADSSLSTQLASVEKSISELRVRLMSQSRSSRNNLLLRDEYQKICVDLKAICEAVCETPAECKMPADVYASRSAEDPLVAKEVESQLVIAGQAAKQLKPLVTKVSERSKQSRMTFAKKVTTLQDEVKRASEDAGTLESLRVQFVALCGEILAAAE